MDFSLFSNQYFKAGIDYHLRQYKVIEINNGIKLVNILTGFVLFENLQLSDILIDGQQATLEILQKVIYSKHCHCELTDAIPQPFRYFDLSFDQTFE